jgi:hypothetical protein
MTALAPIFVLAGCLGLSAEIAAKLSISLADRGALAITTAMRTSHRNLLVNAERGSVTSI